MIPQTEVTKKPGEERLCWVDLLKTLAMYLVIFYHSNLCLTDFPADRSFQAAFFYGFRAILSPCVPLFFFVNGFLLFRKEFDLKRHLKKTLRLFCVTLIWCALLILIGMCIDGRLMSLREILSTVYEWSGWVHHLWFMGALLCLHLVFPLLKLAFDRHRKVFLYVTAAAFVFSLGNTLLNGFLTVGVDVFTGKADHLYAFNLFSIFNPLRGVYGFALAYFCAGGLACILLPRLEKMLCRKNNLLAAGAITLATLVLGIRGGYCSGLSGTAWDLVWGGYDTLFTLVNVAALFFLSLNLHRPNRFLREVSSNTLGIYFLHIPLFQRLTGFLRGTGFFWLCSPLGNALYAAAELCAALLLVLLLKKIPLVRRLL